MKDKHRKLEVPFTQVVNAVLVDPNLSTFSKGLYAYIHSKPDGWNFSTVRMEVELKEKRDTIQRHINELIDAGWLVRERLPNGRVEYTLQHEPLLENASIGKCHRGILQEVSNKDIKVIKSKSNKDIITVPEEQLPIPKKTFLARMKSYYSRFYRCEVGTDPVIRLDRGDGAVLKSLNKTFNEWQIAALIGEHFLSADVKVREAGYPLSWVSSRANQYIARISKYADFENLSEVKGYVKDLITELSEREKRGTM